MTTALEETETKLSVPDPTPNSLAPWHFRAGALAIDILPSLAVVATAALVALAMPFHSPWWWVCVSVGGTVILATAVNRLVLPTISGWSLGRAFFGIAVVRSDGIALGPWRLLLRDLAHLLDTMSLLVGWLWPLLDSRHRTFADLLVHTEVRLLEPDQRPRNIRRLIAVMLLTAALVCVGGAAVGALVVYMHSRAIDQTGEQIAVQGPKIVAEMLTYDPASLQADFAHAQSLTTDNYRGQLINQQQTVQNAHPVINKYWVTNSAVESATPNRATMLMFMQGQRGEIPGGRYITATVRVTFARGPDAHWLVDDLTVLTKPQQTESGQ